MLRVKTSNCNSHITEKSVDFKIDRQLPRRNYHSPAIWTSEKIMQPLEKMSKQEDRWPDQARKHVIQLLSHSCHSVTKTYEKQMHLNFCLFKDFISYPLIYDLKVNFHSDSAKIMVKLFDVVGIYNQGNICACCT